MAKSENFITNKFRKRIIGVYIDSLWKAGSDRDHFSLYGLNLKPKNEKEVITALGTIKFHKKEYCSQQSGYYVKLFAA